MDPAELDRMLSGLPLVKDRNLVVGFSHKDDAAIYRLPSSELIVQTVDYFTPIVDDPYDYGAIAAANSLSDIYAMNGRPLFALNICCFPRKYPSEIWHEVLRGGAEKAQEAGIAIVGGHTVDDPEPKYGLVVTGLVEAGKYWANQGARIGDALILTKPLGTGLISTMLRNDSLSLSQAEDMISGMKTLNADAAHVLARFKVHACTDITGHGLLGHALEVAQASEVGVEFSLSAFPLYEAARQHAGTGTFPGGTFSNKEYFGPFVDISAGVNDDLIMLLWDAQTSGGLLAALPEDQVRDALHQLHQAGVTAATRVGSVISGSRLRVIP
jgi:selenide,water dikinase